MADANAELQQKIDRFQGFLTVDPDNVSLLTDLGDLEHRAGRFSQAEEYLRRAIELQPENPRSRNRLGNVLISQQRFHEAENIFQALLAEQTISPAPALLHNLGLTLAYQDQWDEALACFRSAGECGLSDAQNTLLQAYCLVNLGQTETLEATLSVALEGCEDEQVLGRAAVLQMEYLDFAESVATAERALAKNPDNIDAQVVTSSWLMEQQEVDQAAPQIERILAREPDNTRALLNRALVHMYNTEIGAAITTFETLLELTPTVVGTWVALGWAHIANNDLNRAEETFKHALAINRNFGESHGGLATVYALQGKLDASRESSKRASGLSKQSFGAAYASSLVLEQRGKRDAAVRVLGSAFKKRPAPNAPTLIDAIARYSRRNAQRKGIPLPAPEPKSE